MSLSTKVCMLYSYCKDVQPSDDIKEHADLFKPIFVPQNRFFESTIFSDAKVDDLVANHEWVGHVAYSYQSKIQSFDFKELVEKYKNEYDVIALMGLNHDIYAFAEAVHPGFMEIWEMLISKLGFGDYRKYPPPPSFYCNYWIMRKTSFDKYLSLAKKAMTLIDKDPALRELVYRDSGYRGTLNCLSEEILMEIAGKPYYTFHPFIMERLVCFFVTIDNNKAVVIQRNDNTHVTNTYQKLSREYYQRKQNGKLL